MATDTVFEGTVFDSEFQPSNFYEPPAEWQDWEELDANERDDLLRRLAAECGTRGGFYDELTKRLYPILGTPEGEYPVTVEEAPDILPLPSASPQDVYDVARRNGYVLIGTGQIVVVRISTNSVTERY